MIFLSPTKIDEPPRKKKTLNFPQKVFSEEKIPFPKDRGMLGGYRKKGLLVVHQEESSTSPCRGQLIANRGRKSADKNGLNDIK